MCLRIGAFLLYALAVKASRKRVDNHGVCSGRYEPAATLPGKDPNPSSLLDHFRVRVHCACNTSSTLDLDDGVGNEDDPHRIQRRDLPNLFNGLVITGRTHLISVTSSLTC